MIFDQNRSTRYDEYRGSTGIEPVSFELHSRNPSDYMGASEREHDCIPAGQNVRRDRETTGTV